MRQSRLATIISCDCARDNGALSSAGLASESARDSSAIQRHLSAIPFAIRILVDLGRWSSISSLEWWSCWHEHVVAVCESVRGDSVSRLKSAIPDRDDSGAVAIQSDDSLAIRDIVLAILVAISVVIQIRGDHDSRFAVNQRPCTREWLQLSCLRPRVRCVWPARSVRSACAFGAIAFGF